MLKRAGSAPMMLSGSKVLEGYGRMLVTAVGLNSAQGRILGSLTEAPSDAGDALRRAAFPPRPMGPLRAPCGTAGGLSRLCSRSAYGCMTNRLDGPYQQPAL